MHVVKLLMCGLTDVLWKKLERKRDTESVIERGRGYAWGSVLPRIHQVYLEFSLAMWKAYLKVCHSLQRMETHLCQTKQTKAIWKIYTSKNVSINNYSVFICIHISNKLYRKYMHYYMKLSFYLHIFIVIKCHLPGFIINVFFILAMIFIA